METRILAKQPPDRTLVTRSSHPGKDEGARVQCGAERGAVGAEQGPLCGGSMGFFSLSLYICVCWTNESKYHTL